MAYELFYPNQYSEIPNSPPLIPFDSIQKMRNKYQLLELERKYDSFVQKYQQLLLLKNVLEEYLDIRDALIIQFQRIQRLERVKYSKNDPSTNVITNTSTFCNYNHSYQPLLPKPLQLTHVQMNQCYVPCPNEPKEYKCGCLSIKYYSACACRHGQRSDICNNAHCNEKRYPNIKLHAYCRTHADLLLTQMNLENELVKVKTELTYIRRNSNSLDYEDYQNSISSKPMPKRVSRFPWKNN